MVLKRGHKVRSDPYRAPRDKFQRLKIKCPSHFTFKGSMSKIRGQALIVVHPLSFVLVDQDEIRTLRSGERYLPAGRPSPWPIPVSRPRARGEREIPSS